MRSTVAAAGANCHGFEALWDISKAFDRVVHSKLIEQASQLMYPLRVLALSTASYKWARCLVDSQGVSSKWILPSIGIGQGSAFAVYELAALVIQQLRDIVSSEPCASISLHVDDFSLQAWGPSQQHAATTLIRVAAKVVQSIERDLALPFSTGKALLLGTDPKWLSILAGKIGVSHGKTATSVRRLGYDYALQSSKRNTKVSQARSDKAKIKMRRATRAFGHKSSAKVFFMGVKPGATYGTDLGTPAEGLKSWLRTAALKAIGAFSPGTSPALGWGCFGNSQDPGWKLDLGPLARYHRELWITTAQDPASKPDDVLTIKELVSAFGLAQTSFMALGNKKTSKEPMVAAILSARKAGWVFESATLLRNIQGEQIDLLAGAPEMKKQIYQKQHQQEEQLSWLSNLAGSATHGSEVRDLIAAGGIEFEGVRLLLTSKSKNKCIDNKSKGLLKSIFAGRVSTNSRLFAWGRAASPLCHTCGVEDDTHHRLWSCPRAAESRKEAFTKETIAEALAKGPSLANTRGWIPKLTRHQPEVDPRWRYWVNGEEVPQQGFPGLQEEHPVYLDGSCSNPTLAG